MILTKQNLILFGAALIVGAVFAFGISSLTYQPVPLQVAENPFPSATPPPAAIPTLAPQYIPGSAAENSGKTQDPYAPAQPPVVVTTAPLPTITPTPEGTQQMCCNTPPDQTQQELAKTMASAMKIFGIMIVLLGFAAVFLAFLGIFPSSDNEDGSTGVIIPAILLLITGFVAIPIVNSIVSAIGCVPC